MPDRASLLQGRTRLVHDARSALRSRGWLSNCSEPFREALLDVAIVRSAPLGTEFVHSDVARGGLFAIAHGCAEVALISGHPDARAVHLVHSGFWAGYRNLLGRPRFMSLVARSDVVWALVPMGDLERLLAERPEWWRHILLLADMLTDVLADGFADSTRQDSKIRAAAVLLRLAGCRHADPPEQLMPEIRLSQSDVAAMAVMSRNTFNGIVSELVDSGLIELGYRSIRLRNPAALRAIVTADE
jgi:CRP-like cAMP-binding protein